MIDPTHPADGAPASKAAIRKNFGVVAAALAGVADARGFGALGDGIADDTTALQAALDSGAPVVRLAPGTYRVTRHLKVRPGTSLVGYGAQCTTIDGRGCPRTNNTGILDCKGSPVTLPALASSMVAGGPRVVFASSLAGLLEHGDVVRFRDPTPGSYSAVGDHDGWYAVVHSAEGAVLYPSTPVLRTLPSPRAGSTVGLIQSIRLDRRGLRLSGFRLIGQGIELRTDSPAANGIGVYLRQLSNVVVDDLVVEGAISGGLELHDCARVHVTNSVFTILAGTWNNAGAYAFWVRGGAYVFASNCLMFSGRHAVDISTSDAPAHTVRITNSLIGAPGSGLFQDPDSTAIAALDWHEGTFETAVANCEIQGGVTLRGMGMTVEGCTITRGGRDDGRVAGGTVGTWKLGPALDLRMINNRIVHRGRYWKGAGQILEVDAGDAQIDAGQRGALEFTGNSILMLTDTTDPMIAISDATTRSPPTGAVNISNNHVVHSACSTVQPFLAVSVASFERLVVTGNVLPANVSLGLTGRPSGVAEFAALNTVGGMLEVLGVPAEQPSAPGRLWQSGGGVLRLT